jgi:TPP-dependent pyruvate/acetoin dehydrogenase alpha subunit
MSYRLGPKPSPDTRTLLERVVPSSPDWLKLLQSCRITGAAVGWRLLSPKLAGGDDESSPIYGVKGLLSLDRSTLIAMYRALAGSRLAEAAITDLANRGVLPGHHSGLGHESIGVGVGFAVRPDDCVQMSHRSGMMLAHARGGYSLREAVLSKFGRAPSCAGQIIGRPRTLEVVGLVGTWVPMSVGVAMADRYRAKNTVTVTFFGDGAANEGAVHEAMNLAGAFRLPIVFVLENNGMAISMPISASTATKDLASRAEGYGMPAHRVDGQDPEAIYEAATISISLARDSKGPSLVEVRMLRWEPHAAGFTDLRSPGELAEARRQDGVPRLRARLIERGLMSDADARAIETNCRAEVEAAVSEGLNAGLHFPQPAPYTTDDAQRLVFAS